jgi:hypothetical protein
MQENRSEVIWFRQLQAYDEAAQQGPYGLAAVARHDVIIARMEIGAERLLKLIEGRHEEAQAIMNTSAWGELERLEEGVPSCHTTKPS